MKLQKIIKINQRFEWNIEKGDLYLFVNLTSTIKLINDKTLKNMIYEKKYAAENIHRFVGFKFNSRKIDPPICFAATNRANLSIKLLDGRHRISFLLKRRRVIFLVVKMLNKTKIPYYLFIKKIYFIFLRNPNSRMRKQAICFISEKKRPHPSVKWYREH